MITAIAIGILIGLGWEWFLHRVLDAIGID